MGDGSEDVALNKYIPPIFTTIKHLLSMHIFQKTARLIIKKSFFLSVWLIRKCADPNPCDRQVEQLKTMPEGTLGKDIANCLENNDLKPVPGFESHDLKHVLLGFRMTPEDEIRMQAFMLGNGNYSLPCIAILLYGALWLPDCWTLLWSDFQRGRRALPVSDWDIETYAAYNTDHLRQTVFEAERSARPADFHRTLARTGAFGAMAAGLFGMCFCFPYLWSANVADLVGAGFPFVGGAILFSGGLISLSLLSAKTIQTSPA